MPDPAWLPVTVLALAGLSVLAYAIRALDLLGAAASFFLGLLIALLGGLSWIALMVLFTGLSVVATRVGRAAKERQGVAEAAGGERGVRNVMGNGAAAGIVVLATQVPGVPPVAVAAAYAAAVAAVAADTMASEIGVLAGRARSILPPFAAVRVGSDGGVSLLGQAAALVGAAAVAAAAIPAVGLPARLVWVPLVAGFLGCQVDSLLGATLEGDVARGRPLGKQDVNFLASLLPAVAVLIGVSLAS